MGGSSSKVTDLVVGVRTLQIHRLVGQGTFGKVHVILDPETNKMYALKALGKRRILDKGKNAVNGTLMEKKLLEGCKHPMLVNLLATVQNDENLYMILDFMAGGDLGYQLHHQKWFGIDCVQFWGACVLSGLVYLHKHGIVHRDIKPENIMLDNKGYAHITDFNVSRKVNENGVLKGLCGTALYIAPELHEKVEYDATADVWSFGVLLYELHRGRTPWVEHSSSETKAEIENQVTQETPLQNKLPKNIIKKILRKKVTLPEEFPEDFQSLLNSIFVDKSERSTSSNLKRHSFFDSLSWDKVTDMTMTSPFKPKEQANVDGNLALESAFARKEKFAPLTPEEQEQFNDWEWVTDEFLVEQSQDFKKKAKGKKKKLIKSASGNH